MHTVLLDAQLQLIQDDLHRFSEGNGFWGFDNTSFFQEWFLVRETFVGFGSKLGFATNITTGVCWQMRKKMHIRYAQEKLQMFHDQLFYFLRGLNEVCAGAIVGGDFNTQLFVGMRGQMFEDLFHSFVFEGKRTTLNTIQMIFGFFETQLVSGGELISFHLTSAVLTAMLQMLWI